MFPKTPFPRPELQDDGMVLLVLTASQKVNFPPGVKRAEIRVQASGASSSGGQAVPFSGNGGACGWSSITIDSSQDYFAIVGAASAAPGAASNSGGNPGNDSLFTGPNLLMTAKGGTVGTNAVPMTQAIATGCQTSIPGGYALHIPNLAIDISGCSSYGPGGIVIFAVYSPSSAFGTGGVPPVGGNTPNNLAGNPGNPGVIEIRYKGAV